MPLERRRGREDVKHIRRRNRDHPSPAHRGNTLGDSSSFVEHDRVHIAGALQDLTALDQQPELGSSPGGNHHRCRNREAHCAGTRDYEYGNRRRDGAWQRGRIGKEIPRNECHYRDRHDDRHKHRAHLVGEMLDRSARALRVPHQFHDARENAVLAYARGAVTECASRIECSANDGLADRLGNRKRLACQHRLVDLTRPIDDLPVHGYPLARTNYDRVSRHDL